MCGGVNLPYVRVSNTMPGDDLQALFDDAVYAYTTGDFAGACAGFERVLAGEPGHFEALLSLSLAHYRQGDFARAIQLGHQAETLSPDEQRVHTNLSLFYMRHGDKARAEHHGLRARVAGWKGNMDKPAPAAGEGPLAMAQPKLENLKLPAKMPDMPWKKSPPVGPASG